MLADKLAAAARLAEMNSVLTPEERAVVTAVCGKTQSLRAACREVGMGRKKLERVLRSGLDKLSALNAINEAAAGRGPLSVQ